MSDITCDTCGTANPAGVQFCAECDAYLDWSSSGAPDPAPATTSSRGTGTRDRSAVAGQASRVVAPTVECAEPTVVLDPGAGRIVALHMYNPSPIVDGYRVECPGAPDWLLLSHDEIRLLPHTDSTVQLSCGLATGSLPHAQTVRVELLVRSVTDPDRSTTVPLEVVVPRIGDPPTVTAQPSVVRLVDEITGTVRVTIDNSGSNFVRQVALTASDPEGVVRFTFEPQRLPLPAGGSGTAVLTFTVPEIDYSARLDRQLLIATTIDDSTGPIDTTVSVLQQRSAAPKNLPVQLRLEPSVLRVRDFDTADLRLVIDNRRGSTERTVTVGGRDPQSRISFTCRPARVTVAAGRVAAVGLTISATAPAAGTEVTHPFTVFVSDGTEEPETGGSLTLITSPPAIDTARLRLHPSTISVRNSASGRTRVIVDNLQSDRWLRVRLQAADPEASVRVTFRPTTIDVPPHRSVFAQATLTAEPPDPGQDSTRSVTFSAGDGRSSVECEGTFAQHTSDWMPIARVALTLIGAVLAAIGAFTPWAVTLPDYFVDRLLAPAAEGSDIVAQTQPAARLAVLVLAGVIALTVFSGGGKATRAAAIAMAVGLVGYLGLLTQQVGTGGPMYGAILVVAGAAVAFLGGLCVRKR